MAAEDNTLEWQTPPRTRSDDARDIAVALKNRRGDWARVVKNASYREADDWEWELGRVGLVVRTVRVDNEPIATFFPLAKRYDVYARAPHREGVEHGVK